MSSIGFKDGDGARLVNILPSNLVVHVFDLKSLRIYINKTERQAQTSLSKAQPLHKMLYYMEKPTIFTCIFAVTKGFVFSPDLHQFFKFQLETMWSIIIIIQPNPKRFSYLDR